MKNGELCFLDIHLGSPFCAFAGAPCVLVRRNAGAAGAYTEVRLIGEKEKGNKTWLFHPAQVHRENRPWMRRHVRAIVNAQKELALIADKMNRWATTIAT